MPSTLESAAERRALFRADFLAALRDAETLAHRARTDRRPIVTDLLRAAHDAADRLLTFAF